jgi:hypothetical protein
MLVPVVSACILLMAVFVARDNRITYEERPFQGRGSAALTIAPPVGPAVGPAVASGFSRTEPVTARELQRVALRTTPSRPRITPPRTLPDVPPQTLERIQVDPLDVQPLVEMDEIQISTIAIDRIEISAMP